MPAAYTHHLVASEALKEASPETQNKIRRALPLYFFGAQGPDFCFFDRSINPKAKNLGSFLHREGGFPSFCVLKALASRDPELLAYSLGYIIHYAADSTFHPYVYATAGNSPLQHSRLESILDIRFKRRSISTEYDEFFRKKLKEEEKDQLFLVYTAIALQCGFSAPQKNAFLRSITLFNAYLSMPDVFFGGYTKELKSFLANEEKRSWAYPAAPQIQSNDSADELFLKSVTLSVQLMESFLNSIKAKTPLKKRLFGKGFLTGI